LFPLLIPYVVYRRPIGLTRSGPVNVGQNAFVRSFRVID
jgi:hypothetical protein